MVLLLHFSAIASNKLGMFFTKIEHYFWVWNYHQHRIYEIHVENDYQQSQLELEYNKRPKDLSTLRYMSAWLQNSGQRMVLNMKPNKFVKTTHHSRTHSNYYCLIKAYAGLQNQKLYFSPLKLQHFIRFLP